MLASAFVILLLEFIRFSWATPRKSNKDIQTGPYSCRVTPRDNICRQWLTRSEIARQMQMRVAGTWGDGRGEIGVLADISTIWRGFLFNLGLFSRQFLGPVERFLSGLWTGEALTNQC